MNTLDDPFVYARTVFCAAVGLLFFVGWVQCQIHPSRPLDMSGAARAMRAVFGLGGLAGGGMSVAALLFHHLGAFRESPPYRLVTAAGPPSDPLVYVGTVVASLVGLVLFVAGWRCLNRFDDGDGFLHRAVMGVLGLAGLVLCVSGVVAIGSHHFGH